MVHVKKCPCECGRSQPTTEFYKNGKPQIYCRGWIDKRTDEYLEICFNCADLAIYAQEDLEEYIKQGGKNEIN